MKEQRRICLQRRYNIPPDRSDEGGSGSSQGQGDNGESGESSGSKHRKRPASAALEEASEPKRTSVGVMGRGPAGGGVGGGGGIDTDNR